MSDLENSDLHGFVIDRVDDPIVALPAEGFMKRLNGATPLHALHEAVKRDAALTLAPVKSIQVDRVFGKRRTDGFIDHVRYGLVGCRSSQALV